MSRELPPLQNKKIIGQLVDNVLEQLGITQSGLARKMARTRGSIQSLRQAKRVADIGKVYDLWMASGFTADKFMKMVGRLLGKR